MATKESKKSVKNQKVTKVICQNGGAEIIIPEHEHEVAGVAIGKNSNLGTVVLPTKETTGGVMLNVESISSDIISKVAELIVKIEASGYLDVDNIVRRWIPSQCLRMLNSGEGFHANLLNRGYDYCWKVLVDDLKRQADLYAKKDIEAYEDRNRWYNKTVAGKMASSYIEALHKHIDRLRVRHHEGRAYKRIKCQFMNNGLGVHTDEICILYNKIEKYYNGIVFAETPRALYTAVERFDKMRKEIRFTPEKDCIPSYFINAYKAAGAYYTMKDLIMFEGCLMKIDPEGSTDQRTYEGQREFAKLEESLEALERRTCFLVKCDVGLYGYEMLGLLKEFLQYNHFNLQQTAKKWAEQSEIRKAMRMAKRCGRRSRK